MEIDDVGVEYQTDCISLNISDSPDANHAHADAGTNARKAQSFQYAPGDREHHRCVVIGLFIECD